MKMFALLFIVLLVPARHDAQVIAQSSTSSRAVTLSLRNVPLREALEAVARQSGVVVSVGEPALAADVKVNVNAKGLTARDAVNQILIGTGFRAQTSAVGDILVVRDRGLVKSGRAQGTITGRIIDAKTGRGVSGANVSVDGDSRGVISDENGSYRLTGISVGNRTVVVRLVGYAKQTRSVTMGENATVTLDFKLEPSANVLEQVVVTGTVVASELKSVPNAITVVTAKQIEERGITRIDQLFRGDIPGLFALNLGAAASATLNEVTMFSRGVTTLDNSLSAGTSRNTNPIKTYIDGVEMADPKYLSQIDPKSIEKIEIITGPQASTIYGANTINGVMQIFTKRGSGSRPQVTLSFSSGVAQNNLSDRLAPSHLATGTATGVEGRLSYNVGSSWNYSGAWVPANQMQVLSANGGVRTDIHNKLTVDASARHGWTRNKERASGSGKSTILYETGVYSPQQRESFGIPNYRVTEHVNGRTYSLSLSHRPLSWWSQTVNVGSDAYTNGFIRNTPGFKTISDTGMIVSGSDSYRSSQAYNTTLMIPLTALGRLNLTLGGDHNRLLSSSWQGSSGTTLTGTLPTATVTRNHPNKNSGAFVQGQLGIMDQLFFTYGLRAEWNPNYGDDARVLPGRYGVSYARDIGPVSAKLRGSYGRSIRPPADNLKLGVPYTDSYVTENWGPNTYNVVPNADLGPEFQQGGEGGIELYWSNRGSLAVTRYNQTVDALIYQVYGADSARSLFTIETLWQMSCADIESYGYDCNSYEYIVQRQNINAGALRNQGWELQGSLNFGSLTTRGTYSWNKSRVIGITQKYKALLTDQAFEPGRPFDYAPEHTWGLNFTYAQAASTVGLFINGVAQRYVLMNDVDLELNNARRLTFQKPNVEQLLLARGQRSIGAGYATAAFNATHRFGERLDATLNIENLTNYYQNDLSADLATVGRQTRLGIRWRVN